MKGLQTYSDSARRETFAKKTKRQKKTKTNKNKKSKY